MLDHEEKFLFKEEILHLANALNDPGSLDNVEDLLTDVITSPRFDSEVFTLERSLQVMLGARAGTTLVGLLTVAPEVFDEVAEVRIPAEVHERLVAWRARFGLAIDNALNFLNNPDGIQGHNFATQVAHVEERRVLQGRLTLVRYNNEPQFFVADAGVFLGLVADILERLGPYLEPDSVDAETIGRLREALALVERKTAPAADGRARAPPLPRRDRPEPRQDDGLAGAPGPVPSARGCGPGFMKPVGQRTVVEDGVPADEDAVLMRAVFDLREPIAAMSPVHIPRGFTKAYIAGRRRRGPRRPDRGRPPRRSPRPRTCSSSRGPATPAWAPSSGSRTRSWRAMLRAPAVIVSEGGVGRPIDEIVLNASHFAAHGVPVAGAIVNKVNVDAQPGIADILRAGPRHATGSRSWG